MHFVISFIRRRPPDCGAKKLRGKLSNVLARSRSISRVPPANIFVLLYKGTRRPFASMIVPKGRVWIKTRDLKPDAMRALSRNNNSRRRITPSALVVQIPLISFSKEETLLGIRLQPEMICFFHQKWAFDDGESFDLSGEECAISGLFALDDFWKNTNRSTHEEDFVLPLSVKL